MTTTLAIERPEHHARDQSPLFLLVHCMDPARPYELPAEYESEFALIDEVVNILEREVAKYDAEIAFTDDETDPLLTALERLGLHEDTIVVVTSDHGEGLMRHDMTGHGYNVRGKQSKQLSCF